MALQGLCCLDVRGDAVRGMVEQFISDSKDPADTVAASLELLRETYEDFAACDEILARHAHHWNLGRLALVDRNILRLAVHEMLAGNVPHKVSISEALRLAEEFSTAESARFINGVLDSTARELSEDKEPQE